MMEDQLLSIRLQDSHGNPLLLVVNREIPFKMRIEVVSMVKDNAQAYSVFLYLSVSVMTMDPLLIYTLCT